jgi:GDP-L-fucose synthase
MPLHPRDFFGGPPEAANASHGLAKRALCSLQQAFRAQYGLGGAHLVLANLYGPGDPATGERAHLVPAACARLRAAADAGAPEVVFWGDGTATRELLYVDDAARAIVAAALHLDAAEPVNAGSGEEVSVAEIVSTLARLVGFQGRIAWDPTRPAGVARRCLDSAAFVAATGWAPEVSLADGLARTVAGAAEAR